MMKYLIGIILFLSLTIPCFGQDTVAYNYGGWEACTDGQCSMPQCGTPAYSRQKTLNWEPQRQPQPKVATWRYTAKTGYLKSVVRVQCNCADGTLAKGTGCVLRWGKRVIILTASHVIRGAKAILVRGKSRWHQVGVLGNDSVYDVAILSVNDPSDFDIGILGDRTPKIGETLTASGLGGDDKLATTTGKVVQFTAPDKYSPYFDFVEISGNNRQGDSGGPIFSNGRVVGIAFGSDGKVVSGCQIGRLQLILRRFLGKPVVEKTVVSKENTCLRRPRTICNIRPTKNSDIEIRLARIEKLIIAISQTPGMPGPQGEQGITGPKGEIGPKGDPGSPVNIDELTAQVIERLPPLRIQTLNPDGSVRQDVVARLGDLVRLKPIAVKSEDKK